jgi:hypothetical protein
MNDGEKQFSFTRAAPVQAGAPKTIYQSKKLRAPMIIFGFLKTVAGHSRVPCLAITLLASWTSAGAVPTDAKATAAVVAPTHVSYLEYQEVPWPLARSVISLVSPSAPFKREPDFGKHDVLRQLLALDGDSRQLMALAWDCTAGRLYVDLNRNLDLTDDPGGVFTDVPNYYATFTNLHLALNTKGGMRPFLVDVNLFNYGRRTGGGHAALRSFWQGKLTLKGRDLQVGVVDHYFRDALLTHLLLRPWEERSNTFNPIRGGDLAAFDFPGRLFYQGQGYEVSRRFEGEATPPRYRLEFKELNPALGELQVTGKHIDRVVLQQGYSLQFKELNPWLSELQGTGKHPDRVVLEQAEYTVVLDQPKPVERVPVGAYHHYRVALKSGGAVAYREPSWVTAARFVVNPTNAAALAIGGPLTNTVSISRRSKALVFDYQLAGTDGSGYQFGRPETRQPPEFTVYQGDRKVASGKFQFG